MLTDGVADEGGIRTFFYTFDEISPLWGTLSTISTNSRENLCSIWANNLHKDDILGSTVKSFENITSTLRDADIIRTCTLQVVNCDYQGWDLRSAKTQPDTAKKPDFQLRISSRLPGSCLGQQQVVAAC